PQPDTLSEDDQDRHLRSWKSSRSVRFFTGLPGYVQVVLLRSRGHPQADRIHGPGSPLRMRAGAAGAVRRAALPDPGPAPGLRAFLRDLEQHLSAGTARSGEPARRTAAALPAAAAVQHQRDPLQDDPGELSAAAAF